MKIVSGPKGKRKLGKKLAVEKMERGLEEGGSGKTAAEIKKKERNLRTRGCARFNVWWFQHSLPFFPPLLFSVPVGAKERNGTRVSGGDRMRPHTLSPNACVYVHRVFEEPPF